MMKFPLINPTLYSEELYIKCMEMAKRNPGIDATAWIHLQDAAQRGTISKLEAYDALEIGYLPENLKVRASYYQHLL